MGKTREHNWGLGTSPQCRLQRHLKVPSAKTFKSMSPFTALQFLNQPQPFKAGMALFGQNDVIVDLDTKPIGDLDDFFGHFNITA